MKTRICTMCGVKLPLSEFYNRSGQSGRYSWCKRCWAEYGEKYRKRNSDKIKRRHKKYYAKNFERIIKRVKEWGVENPKKLAIKQKRYNRTFKGRASIARGNTRRRNAYANTPTLTAVEWYNILELYNGKCIYCGAETEIQQDHLIAIARGGQHVAANVAPACRRCNSFKRAKTVEDLPENYQEAITRHAELLGEL